MTRRIIPLLMIALIYGNAAILKAQEPLNKNWDSQKIKGVRYVPYPSLDGSPFLFDIWLQGNVEFSNGEISDTLSIRYSAYEDELIYYNKEIPCHVVIDKETISGFSITNKKGNTRFFRKQYYDGSQPGDHFFEVLSKGATDLIVYRRHFLVKVQLYTGDNGIANDQAYVPSYQYFFYSSEKGYTTVRLNENSFLDQFEVKDRKPVKRVLRKNKIDIQDEETLVLAWHTIEKGGFKVIF
ncbi:MAG: hypothetical protein GZ094_07635 [Mariniphaga sp.]|nr:hypothetical protein [Mariniphaga sp.]